MTLKVKEMPFVDTKIKAQRQHTFLANFALEVCEEKRFVSALGTLLAPLAFIPLVFQ